MKCEICKIGNSPFHEVDSLYLCRKCFYKWLSLGLLFEGPDDEWHIVSSLYELL